MKIAYLMAALAGAAAASSASAQDVASVAASGFRIEARAGADIARISVDGEGASKTGFDYSLEAGYDLPLGESTIIGTYAGIGDSSTKQCYEGLLADDRGCLRSGRDITVGVRGGLTLMANALFYGKAGYSNGRARVTYVDFDDAANNASEGANFDGFHLGAGVEVGLGTRAYGKAEYVYTNYHTGTQKDFGFNSNLERHRILAGVGLRF